MAKKEMSKFLVAAIKRTAMNCSQLTTKKAKLVKKMAEMQEVYKSLSTHAIELAKELIRDKSATKISQRGTEFDDMFSTGTAPALDVQLD